MLRSILFRLIRRQERQLGASLEYLRDVARVSPSGFLKFALIAPLGTHRRHLPRDAWHVARVTAAFAEDCGTCVQIAIDLARRDGVSASVLRAVVAGDPSALPDTLRDVYRFAAAVAAGHDNDELRKRLRHYYADEGLVELSLAIAVSRVIPTLKRSLGHAQSCALLRFDVSRDTTTHRIAQAA
jgi:alkylhydroperoxidase family enzyme